MLADGDGMPGARLDETLAVRDAVSGRAVRQREALANPEALEPFRDLAELRR